MSLENQLKTKEVSQTFSLYDVEDMFLGAIISGVTDGAEIQGKSREWFVQKDSRLAFDAIKKSKETSGYCDYIAIHSELQINLPTIEVKKLLDRLISKVPAEYNPKTASQKLEEFFIKRQANQILEMIREQVNVNPYNIADLFLSASEKMDKSISVENVFDLENEFRQSIEEIVEGSSQKLVIPTGLDFYDSVVGGLPTQEITVIAGRPGHGKTTSLVGLALSILDTNSEKRVTIFEMEMSKQAMKQKFISNKSGVSGEKIRLGTIDDADREALKASIDVLTAYKDRLFIYDDVYDLSTMNKIAKANKSDVILVDFLTLMDDLQGAEIRREIGVTLIRAKRFAKVHNASYVFFAQLNRSVDNRDSKIPEQSDLAESDLITQLASDIVLLSYKYKYTKEPQLKNVLMFYFDKARYASVGQKGAWFDPDIAVLKNMPANSVPIIQSTKGTLPPIIRPRNRP